MITVEDLKEPETDFEFLFNTFIKVVRRETWQERLDAFDIGTLMFIVDLIEYDNLTREQTVYVAKRFQAASASAMKRRQRQKTIAVHAFVIYWLYLEDQPDVPLYVGQTQNVGQRWASHRIGGRHTRTISRLENLRMRIVETVCGTQRDADEAEMRHIKLAFDLNPNLLNRRIA